MWHRKGKQEIKYSKVHDYLYFNCKSVLWARAKVLDWKEIKVIRTHPVKSEHCLAAVPRKPVAASEER